MKTRLTFSYFVVFGNVCMFYMVIEFNSLLAARVLMIRKRQIKDWK